MQNRAAKQEERQKRKKDEEDKQEESEEPAEDLEPHNSDVEEYEPGQETGDSAILEESEEIEG